MILAEGTISCVKGANFTCKHTHTVRIDPLVDKLEGQWQAFPGAALTRVWQALHLIRKRCLLAARNVGITDGIHNGQLSNIRGCFYRIFSFALLFGKGEWELEGGTERGGGRETWPEARFIALWETRSEY